MEKVKKPISAYVFYCSKNRTLIKNENPDATFKEVMQLVDQKWKNLDDPERKEYLDLAAEDKKRYAQQSQKPEKKVAAKRPPTAYLLFSQSIRQSIKSAHPGLTIGEVSKKISESWKALSEEERTPFLEQAAAYKKAAADSAPEQSAGAVPESKDEPPVAAAESKEEPPVAAAVSKEEPPAPTAVSKEEPPAAGAAKEGKGKKNK